jgi:hypothetical protein
LDVEAGDNRVLGGSHFCEENLQGFHSDSQSENRRFIVLVELMFLWHPLKTLQSIYFVQGITDKKKKMGQLQQSREWLEFNT